MLTYLITGIAGFIGSALARALVERGERVRGVDNLATGSSDNLREIADAIELHDLDIGDTDGMRELCRGVDYVLHQAAIPSVPRSVKDPLESSRPHVDGTVSILVAASDAKVKPGGYAASTPDYGDRPPL